MMWFLEEGFQTPDDVPIKFETMMISGQKQCTWIHTWKVQQRLSRKMKIARDWKTEHNFATSFVKFAGWIFFREFIRLSDWVFLKFEMQLSYASMSFPAVIYYGGRKVKLRKFTYVAVRAETCPLGVHHNGLTFSFVASPCSADETWLGFWFELLLWSLAKWRI